MLIRILSALFLAVSFTTSAQESINPEIGDFNRLIVSPHIDIVMVEGDEPSVMIEYENIDVHEIHVDQSGKTLKLFLEHARIVEKTKKTDDWSGYSRGIYHDARITAYITYRQIETLDIRGDQQVIVKSPLRAEHLKLKAYGDLMIDLAEVEAEYFKVSMFGESELTIHGGAVEYQKYTLYGENSIEATDLVSQHTQTNIYGESEISLHAEHELKVSAFGEGIVSYSGSPILNRGLIVGEPKIFSRN